MKLAIYGLMALSPIWEVWNWTDSDLNFWGVVLLLYGTFGTGFAFGRYPGETIPGGYPMWVKAAFVAGVVGFIMLVVGNPTDCAPGECDYGP